MKKKNKSEEEVLMAREEMACYQRRAVRDGVTRFVSQSTLEEECLSLAESKKRMVEKVHNHFRKV